MTRNLLHSTAVFVLRSAFRGVVTSTGMIVIACAIFAAFEHSTLVGLYSDFFPRFRNAAEPMRIPAGAYVVFAAYVLIAVEIALLHRRRQI